MNEGLVFAAAELDEAVSAVQSSTGQLNLNSPGNGLSSEPLVQDISVPNPEDQQMMTENGYMRMEHPGLHTPVAPVQTLLRANGSIGYGAPHSNGMATFQQSVLTTGPGMYAAGDGRTVFTNGIRHPNVPYFMPPANGNPPPIPSVASVQSPAKQMPCNNGTSAPVPNSPNIMHQVVSQPIMENWMDVIHTTNTKHIVKIAFQTNEGLLALPPNAPVWQMPAFASKLVDIQPSQAYKFRVAAVNSRGRGPWSEVTAYKTTVPGLPGAPNHVKVSKIEEGARLSWDDPPNQCGPILEYAVYLSIRPESNEQSPMCFKRVYCGQTRECIVSTKTLTSAFVDTSTGKPAVIFRIAASNVKSYGPATQVRWLQESASSMLFPRPASKNGGTNGSGGGPGGVGSNAIRAP
ncbi:Host cell factor 1 [Orchesella cincta]|uniref:Host cell factor 1 n=1 Tax=Orchesella cincta TaxID=48709 RepID=A0A1D2NDW8_ORCCI|nr:Host cell factor 1 [Orchesella cincta]